MSDIEQFCDKYHACSEGRKWALENCTSMADVWDKLPPEWLVWVATRNGVSPDDTLRAFARWCALEVIHLWDAPQVVREYLETGDASLRAASWEAENSAAIDAENSAARYAASAASWAASSAASSAASWAASMAAARYAASAASWAASSAASWAASSAASWDAQSRWLRDNCVNPFERREVSDERLGCTTSRKIRCPYK